MNRTQAARRTLVVLALLASLAVAPAHAGATVENILVGGVNVNVVLPAGYDASPTARYPVVYLLHGYSENAGTWITQGHIDTFAADKRVIVVTPDGGPDGWYSDWRDGHRAWESFHIDTLVPYIDSHYRTWGTRAGRAIAGLSMGGVGSMSYAARHPDLFVAAASFSGAVDITDKSPVAELAIANVYGPKDDSNQYAVWGNPVTDEVWWHGSNPTDLAMNLRGMSLSISSGDGVPEPDDPVNPTGVAGERAIDDMAQNFDAALTAESIPHDVRYHHGLHTWKYWQRDIAAWWPTMAAAFGAPAPAAFDYRSVAPGFSVWGWSFHADPARAPEFLVVRDASSRGVTITGSGTETVTTGSYFEPGQAVSVNDGAAAQTVVADAGGSVAFTVNLGPAHTLQQYSAPERALDQVPGYFVSRTITFNP